MRNNIKNIIIILLFAAGILWAQPVAAQSTGGTDGFFNKPLCPPGVYNYEPSSCLALGPSQTMKEDAAKGIPSIIPPLPFEEYDKELSKLPIMIAKVEESGALPVYPSYDAAVGGGTPITSIQAGPMRYVTAVNAKDGWVQMGEMENSELSGGWVQAKIIYSYNQFQGMAFTETPKYDIGIMVNPSPTYKTPSFSQPNGDEFEKYKFFWVFNIVEAEGYRWFQASENEWVPSLKARVIHPNPITPEGVKSDRWIDVDLENFVVTVYEKGELIFGTIATVGRRPYYTHPGTFQIDRIYETVTMQDSYEPDRSDYYQLQAVPWALFFDRNTALHGIYWPTMLGFQMSHGCINLSPGDAHWIYNWAKMGDYVYVHGDNSKGDGTGY